MPIHFGVASNQANLEKNSEVAKTIISVLEEHDIPTVWDGDIDKCIEVDLGEHKPYLGGSDDPYEDEDDYDIWMWNYLFHLIKILNFIV